MGHPLDNVAWRKSSYSGSNGGACVEVAAPPVTASPSVTPRTLTARC